MPPASKSSAKKSQSASFEIDWGEIVPLRLLARAIAEGVYAGMHRSVRKGAGVEFGGQRPYVPGDDLRFIDRRSLLRHDRLMVREFETETDRALWLCMDATASMAYRGANAKGSKFAYAALVAAALARVALATGDPVGLVWLGGRDVHPMPATAGREAFERVVGALEGAGAMGDMSEEDGAMDRALIPIARRARKGSVVVFLSDLIDLPKDADSAIFALSTHGRIPVVVQVLDPVEAELSLKGHVRLVSMEGNVVVEADADAVRDVYRGRLEAMRENWSKALSARGGKFVAATTGMPPSEVVRQVVRAIAEARR